MRWCWGIIGTIVLETFAMNLFHGGRLAAMPPKLLNEEGDLHLLRPLAFVAEVDCAAFAKGCRIRSSPTIRAAARRGCSGRSWKLLDAWEVRSPGRRQVMFRRLMNVQPSHLADPALIDFVHLPLGTEREQFDAIIPVLTGLD